MTVQDVIDELRELPIDHRNTEAKIYDPCSIEKEIVDIEVNADGSVLLIAEDDK